MKNLLLLSSLLLLCCFLQAQDQHQPKHEIGLQFSNLDRFNFSYKKQIKENRYWHFGAGAIRAQSDAAVFENTSWQLSTNIHLEFRRTITEKLQFFHGPGIFLSGTLNFQETQNDYFISFAPNYGLGFRLNLSKEIAVTAALYPSISIQYRRTTNDFTPTTESFQYGLNVNSSFAQLGVFYNLY